VRRFLGETFAWGLMIAAYVGFLVLLAVMVGAQPCA
jgi:hypothetical protein